MGRFGKKGSFKGVSLRNPFNIDLPNKMDDSELEFLVACLRVGLATSSEVHAIYMHHVRLAMSIVSNYAWRARHLVPDLVSVAMLAIAESIYVAPEKLTDNNITPYITTRIRGALIDFIGDQYIVPSRTYRFKMTNNPNYVPPVYDSLGEAHARIESIGLDIIAIMETIEKCILQDSNLKRREYKRVIIRLRAAGYNNPEIAKILDISHSLVKNLLTDIRKKFEKEYNE